MKNFNLSIVGSNLDTEIKKNNIESHEVLAEFDSLCLKISEVSSFPIFYDNTNNQNLDLFLLYIQTADSEELLSIHFSKINKKDTEYKFVFSQKELSSININDSIKAKELLVSFLNGGIVSFLNTVSIYKYKVSSPSFKIIIPLLFVIFVLVFFIAFVLVSVF